MKRKKNKKPFDMYKYLSNVYFPLQYLIVHIMLFGFTFEIIDLIPKFFTVFHWQDVIRAIWNFRKLFVQGLTVNSTIMFIYYAIPYFVILLWSLKYFLLYMFVLYQFMAYLVIKYRSYIHEKRITLDNIVVIKIGAPGAGKSSSGLYESVVMARQMWNYLKWEHFKYIRKKRKPPNWKEIEYSYNFFKNSNNVPCLISNIPIQVNGKFTTVLKKEHLEQIEPLPAHSVLFIDEIGAMISVDTAKQRQNSDESAINVSDFFRLCRHFGNWRIVGTEQDSENIYIDVRRVVSKNEYMLCQKWVLKPYAFLILFKLTRTLALAINRGQKVIAPPLTVLEKFCRSIGFRRYRYLTENNTERATGMEMGKRTFYLPSLLNFKYDERTFRNFYKCKDEPIKPDIFTNLILEDTEIYKKMFLRAKKK